MKQELKEFKAAEKRLARAAIKAANQIIAEQSKIYDKYNEKNPCGFTSFTAAHIDSELGKVWLTSDINAYEESLGEVDFDFYALKNPKGYLRDIEREVKRETQDREAALKEKEQKEYAQYRELKKKFEGKIFTS